MYRKADPNTGKQTDAFLEDTNERIHSSVRIRLALEGLGLDDAAKWEAPALKGRWRLKKTTEEFEDLSQRASPRGSHRLRPRSQQ